MNKPDNKTMTSDKKPQQDDVLKTSRQFQEKDSDADPEMLDRSQMIDSVQKR